MEPSLPTLDQATAALQVIFDDVSGKRPATVKSLAQAAWICEGYAIDEFGPGSVTIAPVSDHRAAMHAALAPHADANGILGGINWGGILQKVLPIVLQILQGFLGNQPTPPVAA